MAHFHHETTRHPPDELTLGERDRDKLNTRRIRAFAEKIDPTSLFESDIFNTKKPLPGERRSVFPEGTPGVPQGVPEELIKGHQAQQAQEPQSQAPAQSAEAKPKPKPKPKVVAKPKDESTPTAVTFTYTANSSGLAASSGGTANAGILILQPPNSCCWKN